MERKIHRLPPVVAERIAAGEVIERPASVVKELVENALDAGATEILVSLEDGGKGLIEVLDNGCGMSSEDLDLCMERHATSKLRNLDDLEKIHTLGFRGEALPSIAAVSDLTMISKTAKSADAYEVRAGDLADRSPTGSFKSKKITFGHFINAPHGTCVRATGLFSQIPARLKFLKSQSAEVSHVRDWIERLALAYFHVGFQLVSDDRSLLNLRPQTEPERVREILAGGEDFPVVSASNEQDGFRDTGLQIKVHWLQGLSIPNSRRLVQVVNFRAVKDRVLQQAMLAPFRQALLPGQFPAIALRIDINPAALDVNVHPTKSEVRFLDSRKVFQAVSSVLQSLVQKEGTPAVVPTRQEKPWPENWTPNRTDSVPTRWDNSPQTSWQGQVPTWRASEAQLSQDLPRLPETQFEPQSFNFPEPALPSHPFVSARPIGVLFQTYWLLEMGPEIVVIDQHAAHERVRYEKLRNRVLKSDRKTGEELFSQALLVPETVKFQSEDRPLLESRMKWISELGFEAEFFGEDTLLFRAIPVEWKNQQLKTRLKGLIERLVDVETQDSNVILDEALFETLAREACHSSVRAGDSLEPSELKTLTEQLFQCKHPWNCPHGRPTVVKIPQGKIEEWFQRKI